MSNISLKVVHRLLLLSWLNEDGKGGGLPLSELSGMLKALEKLSLTDEERTALKVQADGNTIKWETKDADGKDLDVEKDFDFSTNEVDAVKNLISRRHAKNAFTIGEAGPTLELAAKLDLNIK